MGYFDKTIAASKIIIRRLEITLIVVNIIINVLSLGYLGYVIYSNTDTVFLLVVYSVLFGVHLANFVFYLIALNQEKRFKKKYKPIANNIYQIGVLLLKLLVIGFSIYEIVAYGYSTSEWVAFIVLVAFYLIQILLQLIVRFVKNCLNTIIDGIKLDVESFTNSKLYKTVESISTGPKGVISDILNKPLSKISSHKEEVEVEEPLSKSEMKRREMILAEAEIQEAESQKKKQDKTDKKVKRMKNQFKGIFKRKKKESSDEEQEK